MLAGKGLKVTLSSGSFRPAANATALGSLGTGGSRPVSIASAVRLDLAAHPMGSLPVPAYA